MLIAFDRDDAGDKAARDLAADLAAKGIECFRVEFPAGADANDVAVGSKDPGGRAGPGDPLGGVDGYRPRPGPPQERPDARAGPAA